MPGKTKNAEITSDQRVFLPELLVSFACDKCGECCSTWEIPVDRDAYDRAVAALGNYAAARLRIADADSHFGYARLELIDGRCAFKDGNLCGIHRDHGDEALFPECRKFPRIMFRSPMALHCTASFACRKTLESLARPGHLRMVHVTAEDVAFSPELCDTYVEGPPCLCRGRAMTWPALFALEHGFLEIARDSQRAIELRILTMIELARNLEHENEAPLGKATVDRELLAARVDGFAELSNRFLLAGADADAQIEFILSMIGRRLESGIRCGWAPAPLDAAFCRWSGLSGDERRGRFLDDYRRLYMTAGDDVLNVLENYMICRVSGNPDFVLLDVQAGLAAVAALLTLARAVAVALAAAAKSSITPRIMLDSIRAVDTAFFHLPDFAERVKKRGADPAALLIVTPA
ncbi:MAG: YkgJ family cysteine cluster protein [Planctomycetes bacterium]|jgi:hypothetical protein|nr:YkgJ family cysteine cluster protein [Planctomycetota bacterium]